MDKKLRVHRAGDLEVELKLGGPRVISPYSRAPASVIGLVVCSLVRAASDFQRYGYAGLEAGARNLIEFSRVNLAYISIVSVLVYLFYLFSIYLFIYIFIFLFVCFLLHVQCPLLCLKRLHDTNLQQRR